MIRRRALEGARLWRRVGSGANVVMLRFQFQETGLKGRIFWGGCLSIDLAIRGVRVNLMRACLVKQLEAVESR